MLVNQAISRQQTIGEDEFNGTMQVEWSKARACMQRWNEELLIVQEDMQRVLVYLNWKAGWWHERSSLWDHMDGTILSGILASNCLNASQLQQHPNLTLIA